MNQNYASISILCSCNRLTLSLEFIKTTEFLGYGKFNYILITICGGLAMSVIIETMAMSYVIPAAECDMSLTLSDKSILSAISFLGKTILY